MIEIEVHGDQPPQTLADLIASTLHGWPVSDASVVETGKLVRQQQEQAEVRRPSHQDMVTLNFRTIEDDLDWSDI